MILILHEYMSKIGLNVDYTSGKQLPLDQQMLKKLASMNRRIDPGMKWTPVFGRYGFLKGNNPFLFQFSISLMFLQMVRLRNIDID